MTRDELLSVLDGYYWSRREDLLEDVDANVDKLLNLVNCPCERCRLLDAIRNHAEGCMVSIANDNPDFGGPNNFVSVHLPSGEFKRFYGESVLGCLQEAAEEMGVKERQWTPIELTVTKTRSISGRSVTPETPPSRNFANGVTRVVVPAFREPVEVISRERCRAADASVSPGTYFIKNYTIVFAIHESLTMEEVSSELRRRMTQKQTTSRRRPVAPRHARRHRHAQLGSGSGCHVGVVRRLRMERKRHGRDLTNAETVVQ